MRAMFAKADRGEIPMKKVKEWASKTPDISSLPEKKKKRKPLREVLG